MTPVKLPYYLQDIMDWTRNSNAERKKIWASSVKEFLFHLGNIIFFKKVLDFVKKNIVKSRQKKLKDKKSKGFKARKEKRC